MPIPEIENPKAYSKLEELKEADPQPEGRAVHGIAFCELRELIDEGMMSRQREFVEKAGLSAFAPCLLLGNPAILKQAIQ
jgi:hypothetical protein